MCGFSGQISFKTPIDRNDIIKSIDAIEYRGPDAVGYWFDSNGKAGIAHRRLSIIDLSSSANQPMLDRLDSLVIAFNGEIYNFRKLRIQLIQLGYHFKTNSDTEVILKAYQEWGVDCLQKLEGMFSFLIMDMNTSTAFMARDIAGEKPFYYHLNDTSFIFSSELKGVLAYKDVTRLLDFISFHQLLNNGYTASNRSLVSGVAKLPPAHAAILQLDTGELKLWKYWELPEVSKSELIPDDDLYDELYNLMNDAVNKQLITDVPLGILLSGGLDSSIITALAAQNSSTIKTFTITVPSHSKFNEADEARLIANHFGTEHTEIAADIITFKDVLSILQKFDEPIFDSSIIPTFLVSSLISKHCKVAIGGDGGDELFGGYTNYQNIIRAQRRSSTIPKFLLKGIGNLASNYLPLGKPGRNYLEHLYPES
ncbi:MAG: asparagine synthase (glutamine-hydrolyzing), partial [Sphaerospermopsis kisseleviana]